MVLMLLRWRHDDRCPERRRWEMMARGNGHRLPHGGPTTVHQSQPVYCTVGSSLLDYGRIRVLIVMMMWRGRRDFTTVDAGDVMYARSSPLSVEGVESDESRESLYVVPGQIYSTLLYLTDHRRWTLLRSLPRPNNVPYGSTEVGWPCN
ncbi:S-adenosyl-L-methionine-dependentmethyltransferases superfamily protein [Striga asiatica]|uniref:S-adenosyl-L-methionine-dependentmethyltransferases superfamily protein n=1 Tax=Striga asiatica TaxID=4170 RepID=A0A5A7PMZ6_STRAF|nr:S-adenosyl-L-methionine-dependentmethyltransferases superfamily protein [Striga asiatica]